MKSKKCKHPEKAIQPGVFERKEGSFMTFGPRKTSTEHVVDWCENCGAIRVRAKGTDPWTPWMSPKCAP